MSSELLKRKGPSPQRHRALRSSHALWSPKIEGEEGSRERDGTCFTPPPHTHI